VADRNLRYLASCYKEIFPKSHTHFCYTEAANPAAFILWTAMTDFALSDDIERMALAMQHRMSQNGTPAAETTPRTIAELSADLRLAVHRGNPVDVALLAMELFIRGANICRHMPAPRSMSQSYEQLMQSIDVGREMQAEREIRAQRGQVDRRTGTDRRAVPRAECEDRRHGDRRRTPR